MICFVFKKRRNVKGKKVISPVYSGRYRLKGETKLTPVALHTSDKQGAYSELLKLVKEREQERCGLIPSKTLRDAAEKPLAAHLEEFLADRERLQRAPAYVRQLKSKINLLTKVCGWRTVKDITADSFLKWRSGQAKLSAKTLNEYHNAAYSFFNWMKRQRRGLAENPLEGIEKISTVGQERFSRRALSLKEITALLRVSGERRPVYALAIYTGLRRAELENLQWGDLWLEVESPYVRARASTTKNRKSATLGLHPVAAQELRALRAELGHVEDTQSVFGDLFPSSDDLRADLANAGIKFDPKKRVDFHSLRHTFGTMLTLAGVSPRVAMELMRHSDMRLTMKTYTDADALPTMEAVSSLPDFIGTPESAGYHDAQIRTQKLGGEGPSLSHAGALSENGDGPQTLMDKGSGRDLSHPVALGRENEDGARCRVRTCDFLRVKQALYH